jgi:hypothetical protein
MKNLIINKAIKICRADHMQFPDFDESIPLTLSDALTVIVTHDEEHDTEMESDKVYNLINKDTDAKEKLIERLKECFKAMDDSLDWMDELGLNLKESNCYTVLACELAPTDTLLRELKEDDSESSEIVYICKSGSEILRGDKELVKHIRDRNTDDKNQCSDEFLINEALSLNEYLVIDEEDVNLMEACDKVTIEMMKALEHGEELELNDKYTLHHYSEEDVYTINKTDDWEEVLQVMTNGDAIEFESLI